MEPLRELSTLITRHASGPDGKWQNDSLGLMFASASCIPEPSQQVFALVVQGEKQLLLGNKLFSCGKGSFIVSAPVAKYLRSGGKVTQVAK